VKEGRDRYRKGRGEEEESIKSEVVKEGREVDHKRYANLSKS